jgi:hypothetical protein
MTTSIPQPKRQTIASFFESGMLDRKSIGMGMLIRYKSVAIFKARQFQSKIGDIAG